MRNKLKYYITADTHLGHNNLTDYCSRPVGFSERIIKNHANIIKENDILIHLGDICIGNDKSWHEKFFEKLKSKNWLVKGNHDRGTNNWYFSHGWDMVAESLHMKIFGVNVLFTHIPVYESVLDHMECDFNIHGHLHGGDHREEETNYLTSRHILVKMEHNYEPVDLRKLLNK